MDYTGYILYSILDVIYTVREAIRLSTYKASHPVVTLPNQKSLGPSYPIPGYPTFNPLPWISVVQLLCTYSQVARNKTIAIALHET